MNTHPEDVVRTKALLQNADKAFGEARDDLSQTQVNLSKERTQFFEKLTFGAGAAIAAIVSFLGVHASTLQPHWALRCSLISLGVMIISALFRNFLYPNYVLAVKNRVCIEVARYQQQCKDKFLKAEKNVVSWQSGEQIDLQEWTTGFIKSDSGLGTLIQEQSDKEKTLWNLVKWPEYVCIFSFCIATLSLVWMALCSF